jgi:hypothetical protein
MSKTHFFTDIDLLLPQNQSEGYGAVGLNDQDFETGKDKYRLYSAHRSTVNSLAYAVCQGQILVQQDSVNENLVNIVLKPEVQPEINLPSIKYFIYRGILKSSLIDGENVANGDNTLAKSICSNNAITPKKVLGIELTGIGYLDSDIIENSFYFEKSDFELWKVQAGWSIGSFDKDGFGFEIVLDCLQNQLKFESIRKHKNILEIQQLNSNPSISEQFEFKTKKEIVLSYLDPCAFYGCFYDKGIYVRSSTDQTDSNFIHNFTKKKGNSLYRDIIEGGTENNPSNIFKNKNIIYIDIRNELNYSFNYFENLNNEIKYSTLDDSSEPITLIDYYVGGWPILRFDSINGGTNNTIITLALPIFDKMSPLLCVLFGKRKIPLTERIKKGKSAFINLSASDAGTHTSESIRLIANNYNSTNVISQYFKLIYLNQSFQEYIPINTITPIKKHEIDFVFQPNLLNIPFVSSASIQIKVYEENVYVNKLFSNGIDYMSKIGIAKDTYNTILFWAVEKRNEKKRFKANAPSYSIVSMTDNSELFFIKYIAKVSSPDTLVGENHIINSNTVQLVNHEKNNISFFSKKNRIDLDAEFGAIILSNSQYAQILDIANSNFGQSYSPYLIASNVEQILDDNQFPVLKIDLALKGLIETGLGGLELIEIPTEISIYSTT